MGLFLIILGVVLWLLVNSVLGLLLIIIGVLLLFVPGTAGYTDWRRRPPR